MSPALLLLHLAPPSDDPLRTLGADGAWLTPDLDGDGRSELVLTSPDEHRLLVFRSGDLQLLFALECPGSQDPNAPVPDALDLARHFPERFALLAGRHGESFAPVLDCPSRGPGHAQRPRSALGDFDGDGNREVVVACTPWILLVDPDDEPPVRRLDLGLRTRAVGLAVARPGDVDGDGADDLAVASTATSTGILPATRVPGFLTVFSVARGRTLWERDPGGHHGHGVACPGDLDGDGVDDVVTASHAFLASGVRAFSGRTGARLWDAPLSTGDPPEPGRTVAGGGDLDGDGTPDVVTTAFHWGHAGIPGQGAIVLSGRDGAVLARVALNDEGRPVARHE